MAVDLYTLFFSRDSTQHDLNLPSAIRLHNNNLDEENLDLPSAVRLHHNNLDDKNTQQLILHPEEAMKRKRNETIALSENIRRKKMKNLLSILHSLLPVSTTLKLTRHCILEETGKYIQNLQSKAQELQKKKAQLLAIRGSLMDHISSAIDVGIEVYSSEIVIIRISA
ncbi:hypothetical protein SUGI_0728160 [Cryptomeria japonica]|nr:hypothetical protein SUGI_0728160 [Cryptomeria japonica]